MKTVVRFTAGDGDYAVPVEQVREVRSGDALMPLPEPRPGVIGLLPVAGGVVAVLDTLGAGRDHVLLLTAEHGVFGLRVGQVTSVEDVGEIGPAPAGQDGDLVEGVITAGDTTVLLVDVARLADRLQG